MSSTDVEAVIVSDHRLTADEISRHFNDLIVEYPDSNKFNVTILEREVIGESVSVADTES